MGDLYSKMGSELRAMFKDLFSLGQEGAVRHKMANIVAAADQIGGALKKDADTLQADVEKFLQKPNDQHIAAVMKMHAARLEHETREL